MCDALQSHPSECGGVLGAAPKEPISKFYFDVTGISTSDSYTPDYIRINEILSEWETKGIFMVGIVHSHDNGGEFPSCGDLYYCQQILHSSSDLTEFLLPIVILDPFSVNWYSVTYTNKHLQVKKIECNVID